MARIASAGMESITRPHGTGITNHPANVMGPTGPTSGPKSWNGSHLKDAQATPEPAPRCAAGSAVRADPVSEKEKTFENLAEKSFRLFLLFPGNKSSPLLPERSCEQLSHCTTSTITNCSAVLPSATQHQLSLRSAQQPQQQTAALTR